MRLWKFGGQTLYWSTRCIATKRSVVIDSFCDLNLGTVLCCANVRCRTSVERGSKEVTVLNLAIQPFIKSAFIQKKPFVLRLNVLIFLDAKAPLLTSSIEEGFCLGNQPV